MSEPDKVECTAFDTSATSDRNALFTPPCACPRCTPLASLEDDAPDTIWLRNDGRLVRYAVETMELSQTGRTILG